MSSNRAYRHEILRDDEINDAVASRVARKNRRKRCLKISLWISIIFILIVIVALAFYFAFRNRGNKKPHVCISPDVCNTNLLDYIDSNHNPCDDFYSYSCGNWLSDNPLNGRDGISIFGGLFTDNYRHLRGYLSRSVQDSDPAAIKKSKYIYSSCADVGFIQDNFVEHVQDFIRDAGGWSEIGITPDTGWDINRNLANDHYLGSSALFDFDVSSDDLDSSEPVIRISQAGLTLASPQAYQTSDFDDFIDDITQLFDGLDHSTQHHSLATDIAHFERSLAEVWLTDTELRNISALYNPMTLGELQTDLFNMDWVGYFNTIFNKAGLTTVHFTPNSVVIVNTPTYFKSLNQIISNDTRFITYAKWQLLLSEYVFATASLEDSWTIMHEKRFPQSSRLSESASFACVELAEAAMPFAVARPFVDELINKNTTGKVNKTINEIEAAFLDNLMEKNWLDDITKNRCMDKVEAITRQIAYPDFIEVDRELDRYYASLQITSSLNHFQIGTAIREFIYHQRFSAYTKPIDKTQWLVPPTQVNAYYSPEFNQFVFLAGILRPPFFASNYPPFLLYGGLGSVIGHELTHGFDDQGQQYNKYGNRVQWWTDQSMVNFKELTKCFVDQYGNYTLQGHQIDGQLTLGENIADNGGIRTAFRAYKNAMNGTTVEQPLIHGHTVDQLFFVAFAQGLIACSICAYFGYSTVNFCPALTTIICDQLWCSRFSDDHLKTSVQTDPHSPGEFRVFGTLVNNRDFAAAFNCSSGSKMNPPNKCQLW